MEVEVQATTSIKQAVSSEAYVHQLMSVARGKFKNRDYRAATSYYRHILVRKPDHLEALYEMAQCLKSTGDYENALKCLKACHKINASGETAAAIGEAYYLLNQDQSSLEWYRRAMSQMIQDSSVLFEAYKNVGNIFVRAGDFDAAEEFYNKAFVLNSKSDALLVNFGTLEIQRGQFTEGIERFREAININSSSDRAWVGLALCHRHLGDTELALGNAERALDHCFYNETALRLLVEWAVELGRFSTAVTALRRYLELYSEDVEISYTLAKLLVHMGALVEARYELERVSALDPSVEGIDTLIDLVDTQLEKSKKSVLKI